MNHLLKSALLAAALAVAGCDAPPAAPSPAPNPTPNPAPGPSGGGFGTHTVSWTVGDECTAVPAQARNRTYSATVENGLVTLTSGVFLEGAICTLEAGLGCNQFRLTQDGDNASIVIEGNEWHGGQIVERIEDGTWLEVLAKGTARVEGSTIRGVLEGSVWYCPTSSSYPFPCKSFKACTTNNMQMTIVRKQ